MMSLCNIRREISFTEYTELAYRSNVELHLFEHLIVQEESKDTGRCYGQEHLRDVFLKCGPRQRYEFCIFVRYYLPAGVCSASTVDIVCAV